MQNSQHFLLISSCMVLIKVIKLISVLLSAPPIRSFLYFLRVPLSHFSRYLTGFPAAVFNYRPKKKRISPSSELTPLPADRLPSRLRFP